MAAPGETVPAAPADNMAFAADELADGNIGDVGTGGDDFADELMADGEALANGGAGPGVPVVDVEVVPQMPVARTRILTSLMPISGSGTSSSHRPRSSRLFTNAFTLVPFWLQLLWQIAG